MSPEPGVEVSGLHKSFAVGPDRVEVLRGVDMALADGEAAVITGPSGSGKSTLLHVLGTLDRPSSGAVSIGGVDPFGLDERELARFRNATVGFVFQHHHLLPQYTVLENVLLPTWAFSDSAGDEAWARELLRRVDLDERLDHRPAQLSGGERQRVALARGLVNRPRLLLCDEPTGSLDQRTAGAVGDLLFELHEAAGAVLVVVTHSLELAERFAHGYQLVDGRCVAA